MEQLITEVEAATGLRLGHPTLLHGGSQGGAWSVVAEDGSRLVLKLQPDPERASALLCAAPVITRAVRRGWPAAAWVHWGPLRDGGAFVLQEFVEGDPIDDLDVTALRAVLAANARQAGLADHDAVDDTAQLDAVTRGRHPWRGAVSRRSPLGRTLVDRGSALLERLGRTPLPREDLTHGDYSTSNLMRTRDGRVLFIDAETVGRGTRVRDLADLYRQLVVYPHGSPQVPQLLFEEAQGIAGPAVFATCFVAVSYNNLAWWVEYKTVADFDVACGRLVSAFDRLAPG